MLVPSLLLSIALSSCSAHGPPGPTSIHLNSSFLSNQSEVVLTAGSTFSLCCNGNGSIHWSTNAFVLLYKKKLPNPIEVRNSNPRNTGTYRCGYTNKSLGHLDTWIHLYVKDPTDPSSVFVLPRSVPSVKEGQDFLFSCLLTDPSVKDLTFQSESSTGQRGQGLPPGMNVTFDPRRGVLIRDLQRSFNGQYVCSGWKDGRQFRSQPINLLVIPSLRKPPSLSVSQDNFVRLEGEKFEVTCLASNPSHFYRLSWTHPNIQNLNVTTNRLYRNNVLYIKSTLTVSAVNLKYSGRYMCTAENEAGVATATTQLRVLDGPYMRIYLQLMKHANVKPTTTEVKEELFPVVSSLPLQVQEELDANSSSGLVEVNRVSNNSTTRMDVNRASRANISGSTRVEVNEGRDVKLSFIIEAYPPISDQSWVTPPHVNNDNNTVSQEHYTANGYRSCTSLLLRRVRWEDRGQYSFNYSNLFFSGSQNIDLRIYRSPSAVITMKNDTLTCTSSGYPSPTIFWSTCPGVQDTCADVTTYEVAPANETSEEENEVRIHLPFSPGDDVTVECVAYNTIGKSHALSLFKSVVHSVRNPSTLFSPALLGSLSSAAILLLLLLVVSYKWRQKPKYEIRWKIIDTTDGNNYTFLDPTQLPYNHKWEFPRDKLRLGAVLGSGAFGKVVEATAYGLGTDNNFTRVAVKMLKPSAHSEEREALMSELKILSHLGYHDNIVNLLGACTQGGPMLMITEYCCHGDLLNFLRSHAQDFMASILSVNEVEEEAFYKNISAQHARLRSDSGISCCSEYQEMQPVLSPGQTHRGVQTDSLSVSELMRFSYDVAQGLDFLSSKNCIHRDVAARNVLLTDRHVAKICDFGLARDIRNDDSYIVQGNARLPVKWMAPESIFECVYTVQSDVWSYGVLLWEIFSLGKSPYPNTAVDTNFYKMIKDGHHMSKPDFAPAEMYQLMTLCWSLEPNDRPTFKMIGQLINRLLPSGNDKLPHHSNQSMYRNIDECREEEEDEETRKQGGEDEHRDDDDDEEEREWMMKNIYQLS
ncbi:macrophage colony-stimulating factor 1 receptor 2 isoform X2 [Channa argus]|uniref:macrophage colony-stimulating factor 1 receptor 2 isoform X2 n=1 Tax=Channa argus TaxID=215402 RepID=UPI0035206A8C